MEKSRKIALVTGANKGLGFEVCRQLAKAGFKVLLGSRDIDRGMSAAQKLINEALDVRFVQADLNHAAESGLALAASIGKDFGHLDALINNAGIAAAGDGLPGSVSADTLRSTFNVNFYGPVLLTQPLLPLLRAANYANVVNVSSGLGSLATNSDPNSPFSSAKALAYNASKAALNMFTLHLAYELRDTNVKVNSVSPGYVATDLTAHRGVLTVEQGAVPIVKAAQLPVDGPSGRFLTAAADWPW